MSLYTTCCSPYIVLWAGNWCLEQKGNAWIWYFMTTKNRLLQLCWDIQSVLAFIHTDVLIECRYSTSNARKQKLQEYLQTLYIGLRYQWFNVGRSFLPSSGVEAFKTERLNAFHLLLTRKICLLLLDIAELFEQTRWLNFRISKAYSSLKHVSIVLKSRWASSKQ